MKIFIKDNLHPEDNAMVQAMCSRSPADFEEHIDKVEEVGSGNFMDQFYVGYNHASIGDCGSTTIFIKGVSMLMAKAVQDNPLYSGQESSTRYMDFSKVQFETPGIRLESHFIQHTWMGFYHRAFPELLNHFREQFPRKADETEKWYENALRARTFDVLRAFIPAGAHTNLTWHTNLRQARDKLRLLLVHPETRTAEMAAEILSQLNTKYPHSGFAFDMSEEEWVWRREVAKKYTYLNEGTGIRHLRSGQVDVSLSNFSWPHDRTLLDLLGRRPRHVLMPGVLAKYGTITSQFELDFGSFRDLQRHRNGFIQMPLLTTDWGFHPWYLQQMPAKMRAAAEDLIQAQIKRITILPVSPVEKQSYIAMGFKVPCLVTQTLPAFAYRVELRSSKSVHPTLRHVAQAEAVLFMELTNHEISLHVDMSDDIWDTRRGTQTIEAR